MAMTSGVSAPSRSGDLRYALFTLNVDLWGYEGLLNTERFDEKPSNSDAEKMYDVRNGFNRDAALGASSWRQTHCGGRGAVLQNDDNPYGDTLFRGFEEEYGYESPLAAVFGYCYSMFVEELSTAGLNYTSRVHPWDEIYFFD